MNELLTASATELARRIRKGELTSRQAVEAHILQVERVNPVINAMVRDRFETALHEADRADNERRTSDPRALPPLHGVPCTIKENFAFAGMPHTAGLVARRDVVAEEDCVTVQRLREAGAIPLGVTNVPELCMWVESHNRVYGRTRNPYNPKHIVGGSSGGEGAIIGSGASPFGLGGDVGGSIRLPAFFNGVFGHKATGGTVPTTGQHPAPENGIRRYCQAGPLARRAEDLMPLLKILSGPDGVDTECRAVKLGNPDRVRIGDLRVVSIPGNGARPVSADLVEAQAKAAAALAESGASVCVREVRELRHSFNIWAAMMAAEGGTSFTSHLGNGGELRLGREVVRWLLGRSGHTLPALGLAITESLPLPHGRYLRLGATLRERLLEIMGPDGVLLYPSFTSPAPRHFQPLLRPFDYVYTGIINVMGFPATQVPMGLNANGLPLGVQVVGAPGNDHVTIAVARHLERVFGGWIPPWQGHRDAVSPFRGSQARRPLLARRSLRPA